MGGSFCPATALLLMDKNWDIPVLCNYFSLHGPRSPQSRIITRVSSLQPEELPSPAMVQGKRTALLLWLGTLVLTCIISEKSPLLIFCILGIDKPSAGAGGVSSHRVLLKKGAIWPGHPMSSHGVLGEKRVLSVRGISPRVHPVPTSRCHKLDKLINTRHQRRRSRQLGIAIKADHQYWDDIQGVWWQKLYPIFSWKKVNYEHTWQHLFDRIAPFIQIMFARGCATQSFLIKIPAAITSS